MIIVGSCNKRPLPKYFFLYSLFFRFFIFINVILQETFSFFNFQLDFPAKFIFPSRYFPFPFISYSTSSSFFDIYSLVSVCRFVSFHELQREFVQANSPKYHEPIHKHKFTIRSMSRELCDYGKDIDLFP